MFLVVQDSIFNLYNKNLNFNLMNYSDRNCIIIKYYLKNMWYY